MTLRIAVLPGDDIGPEIVDATLAVWETANRRFGLAVEFQVAEVGMASHRRCGTTLPDAVVRDAIAADGVLLGPAGMTCYPPAADGGVNIPGTIRKELDLYANIRPARGRVGLPNAIVDLDCVIVRENTEGFYADRSLHMGYGEFMPSPDVAMSVRLITAKASRRIAKQAFEIARERRKQVTVVGKRHVLQVTDGLFMREVTAVAADYPDVALREVDIDAMTGELYLNAGSVDVVLTTNMFGDILSNLANALAGSLGLSAALNVGRDHAAANAGHGSAPVIAGRDVANPSGLILSAAMLLDWLGLRHEKTEMRLAGRAMEKAVDYVLADPALRTRDLGGTLGTREFARRVADAVCDDMQG